MSPGPHQQHHRAPELDLERKEELILAKQLRACRVNILPRYNQDTCYQLRQPDLSQLHNITTRRPTVVYLGSGFPCLHVVCCDI